MPVVGLVSNRNSRRNRRDPGIFDRLVAAGRPLGEAFIAERTASLEDLAQVARRFAQRGVEVLAVHGGDGTTHHVLSAVLPAFPADRPPALLLLRGGTMNTVARGFGIDRGESEEVLAAAVAHFASGSLGPHRPRAPFAVFADDRPPAYGFLFGNGLASGFLSVYYDDPDPGPWTAVTTLSRLVWAAAAGGPLRERALGRVRAEVVVDGWRWDQEDSLAVVVGAVPEIGLGFRPWYGALDDPRRFHAIALGCTPMGLVRLLPRLRAGKPAGDPLVLDRSFSTLDLRFPEPQGFMIDGDYHQPARAIRVTAGPCLDVLLPTVRSSA